MLYMKSDLGCSDGLVGIRPGGALDVLADSVFECLWHAYVDDDVPWHWSWLQYDLKEGP